MKDRQSLFKKIKSVVRGIILLPVRFYKTFISPLLPNSCKYTPSCSVYMMDSVNQHGIIKGVALGLWRLLRCNPFSKGGFDPVKQNLKGDIKWLL